MVETYKAGRRWSIDWERMQPHELLLGLGAILAILLGLLFFAVEWGGGLSGSSMTAALTILVVDVVLGATLFIGARIAHKNHMNGAIVGAASAVILIIFGGQPGIIGGLLGLVGTMLAVVSPYLPWAKRT